MYNSFTLFLFMFALKIELMYRNFLKKANGGNISEGIM